MAKKQRQLRDRRIVDIPEKEGVQCHMQHAIVNVG